MVIALANAKRRCSLALATLNFSLLDCGCLLVGIFFSRVASRKSAEKLRPATLRAVEGNRLKESLNSPLRSQHRRRVLLQQNLSLRFTRNYDDFVNEHRIFSQRKRKKRSVRRPEARLDSQIREFAAVNSCFTVRSLGPDCAPRKSCG